MKISVLFFGATADAAGRRRIELETDADRSGDIFDRIISEYPALAGHRLLYSVNQQYSDGSEQVKDGDELAIFTAVSGG